jgi:hypothetical protein
MPTRLISTVLAASVAMSACKVEPAPEDLDGLTHWFWQHLDDEEPDALQAGAASLYQALDGAGFEGPLDGTITTLSADETALVGHGEDSLDDVYGVFMANDVGCSTDLLEYQIYAPNQAEMHPDTYLSYEREFTSDLEAFQARETEWLHWESYYVVDDGSVSYEATIIGTLRYIDEIDADLPGPLLVSRGVLDEPAYTNDDQDRGMMQDYQLEVYFPRGDETLHLYAMWRDAVFFGMDFGNGGMQTFVLNGMEGWDEDSEELCGVGP